MSAIKKNGRWYFRKRVKGHARIFVSPSDYGLSNTKVGADEAGRRRIAELVDGRPAPPRATPVGMTFDEFSPVYIEHSEAKNAHSTVEAKRQILRDHLAPRFGALPMSAITFAKIEDLKNHLVISTELGGLGLSNKTANNVLTVLRRLLVLANKRGKLESVPEVEWLPTEAGAFDFLTFDESYDLVDAATGEWATMILVGIRCGLRQGELLGLRWEDVDLKLNRLNIRQSIVRNRVKSTKSRKYRVVDLGDEVRAALAAHRHLRGPLVFCDADGRQLTKGECKWPLWHACTGAQLRRIGWHVLRHTFCSHLAMRGAMPQTIQKLAGHSTLRMTERYMHLSPNVTQDAVKLLDRGARLVPTRRRKAGSGRE
jgi:integrase